MAPLYKKTILYLINLIMNNLETPNFQLPTEAELVRSQNISRITARKAYKEIENQHLITRVKGKGTFITPGITFADLEPHLKDKPTHPNYSVGIILPLFDSQHIMEINAALLEAAGDIKLITACSSMSQKREQQLIAEDIEMGINGLIIYPVDNEFYNSSLLQLATSHFPIIMLDRTLPGLNFLHVSSDHKLMVRLAVQHLLDRNNAHILFFNSNIKTNSSLATRRDEYIKTLYEHKNFNNYFFNFDGDTDPSSKSFANSFSEYLKNNPQITAIVASDYASGIHLLQLADILGISFPKDYEAVFLDFKTPNNNLKTELPTYIEQDSFKLGFEAMKLIRQQLEKPDDKLTSQIIPVKLVQGYSTRPL